MPFTLAGHSLVQARFTRNDGDIVVNTFVFRIDFGGGDGDIVSRLDTFYTEVTTGQTTSLRARMSDHLTALEYVIRDADDPVGTPGRIEPSLLWTPPPANNTLPPELAVCSSYRAAPPNTARRRGRIYLGPLASNAMDGSGSVLAAFRTDLAAASRGLASDSIINPVHWGIASRVNNEFNELASGYVDAEFDHQQRRALADPVRTEWTLP